MDGINLPTLLSILIPMAGGGAWLSSRIDKVADRVAGLSERVARIEGMLETGHRPEPVRTAPEGE